jgi:hypothetical protein
MRVAPKQGNGGRILETNPYEASLPSPRATKNAKSILAKVFVSSIIFILAFLWLGSFLRTWSLKFAFSYAQEMLTEPEILTGWVLPLFVGYAAFAVWTIRLRSNLGLILWPLVSGTTSFLLFNQTWEWTQSIASFLRPLIANVADIDTLRAVICPLLVTVAIECAGMIVPLAILGQHSKRSTGRTE